MIWSITTVLRGWKALTLSYGFEERMFSIAEFAETEEPSDIDPKMFPYLYKDFGSATMLKEYLCYAQDERGLLKGVELERRPSDKKPIIKQGNLRADGTI